MTAPSDFTFSHRLRVRWAECDAQGIVFNVNYFLYFDVALTEYMRALGYHGPHGLELFTVHAEADFRDSAVFDDWLDIGVRCARLGEKSFTVALAIFRDGTLLTEGRIVYAHAERGSKKTMKLPTDFLDAILSLEKTPPERKTGAV